MNDANQASESDVWFVQVASGIVRVMTLDELDAAFQSGLIGETTRVRQDGTSAWSTLAEVAGIEAERTPSAATYAVEGAGLAPESIRPVVSALHDLEIEPPTELRPRKRGTVLLAVAAMALLGGIGFAGTKLAATSAKAPLAAASLPVAASPIAALPSNLTAAISEAHLGEQTLPSESKLTDAQKKVLLDADKKRDQLREEKKARTPKSKKRSPPSGPVFHSGGNVHDPLNSSIGSPSR